MGLVLPVPFLFKHTDAAQDVTSISQHSPPGTGNMTYITTNNIKETHNIQIRLTRAGKDSN